MICPKCGRQMNEGSNRCYICGYDGSNNGSTFKGGLLILVILMIGVGIGVFAKDYFFKEEVKEEPNVEEKEEEEEVVDCGGKIIDERDGNEYQTVLIGDQCWMAENLRYFPEYVWPRHNAKYAVYGYEDFDVAVEEVKNTQNYQKYGVLYEGSTVIGTKLCPVNWHVPTMEEFGQLIEYAGGEVSAGKKLKSKSSPENGTDDYGFGLLLGGNAWTTGATYEGQDPFMGIEEYGYFWTSERKEIIASHGETVEVLMKIMIESHNEKILIEEEQYIFNGQLYSIRCIKS